MSPTEMAAHCRHQIAQIGPDGEVMFVVPTPWKGQKRMRLAGPGSPTGEPVGHVKGGTGVFFKAATVLDWLKAMGDEGKMEE